MFDRVPLVKKGLLFLTACYHFTKKHANNTFNNWRVKRQELSSRRVTNYPVSFGKENDVSLEKRSTQQIDRQRVKSVFHQEIDIENSRKGMRIGRKGVHGAAFHVIPELSEKLKKELQDGKTVVTKSMVLKEQNIGNDHMKGEKTLEEIDYGKQIQNLVGIVPVKEERLSEDKLMHVELVPYAGESLEELFDLQKTENNEIMTYDFKKNTMHQLAQQIDKMHKKGIVHRDIHPSNITINQQGKLSLIDYGEAINLHHTTGLLNIVGSIDYLPDAICSGDLDDVAIEVINRRYKKLQMHDKDIVKKLDVYALGLVFMEIACPDISFKKIEKIKTMKEDDRIKYMNDLLKNNDCDEKMIDLICKMTTNHCGDIISSEEILSDPLFLKEENKSIHLKKASKILDIENLSAIQKIRGLSIFELSEQKNMTVQTLEKKRKILKTLHARLEILHSVSNSTDAKINMYKEKIIALNKEIKKIKTEIKIFNSILQERQLKSDIKTMYEKIDQVKETKKAINAHLKYQKNNTSWKDIRSLKRDRKSIEKKEIHFENMIRSYEELLIDQRKATNRLLRIS